jgi:hypothetical protein
MATTTSSNDFTSSAKLERETSFPIQALLNVAELDNRHTDDTNSDIKPPTENEEQSEVHAQENVSATSVENEPNDEKSAAAVVISMKEEKDPESPRPQIDFESILGHTKWCKTCKCWKPDRTHHCSICDECVLKMDQ